MKLFKSKNRKIKATGKSLNHLFADIDIIQIKNDGVHEDKALSNDIVLKIDEPSKIQELKKLMAINEPDEDFHCMCLGDYAIELLKGSELKSTIGFHHGVSIRFNQWTGDADLKYPNELLELLSDLGLKAPLEQKKLDNEQAKKNLEESKNWLENSPRTFQKYFEEMRNTGAINTDKMRPGLNTEFPNKKDLILALLRSYGTTENLWTAYASYQSVPQELLDNFSTLKIIEAYRNSAKSFKHTIGLGRYLFTPGYKSQKSKKHLTPELLELLQQAFEKLQDKKGLESIEKIKNNS